MSGWARRVGPERHRCRLPGYRAVKREGLGEESLWECVCGARYKIIGVCWPTVSWTPEPGSWSAIGMMKPEYQPVGWAEAHGPERFPHPNMAE